VGGSGCRICSGATVSTIPAELLNTITTGDCRELSRLIPDESVDLIFTDPVYDRIEDYEWLAREAVRVLKPGGDVLVYVWNEVLDEVLIAMGRLHYRCTIAHYHPGRVRPKFINAGFNLWTPILWLSKNGDKRVRWRDAFQTMPEGLSKRTNTHQWAKPQRAIRQGIEAFTQPGGIVYDPFTGGGTVPAVCKMLGRQYIASEIDPDTAERARERVLMTQPPLPGHEVEQQTELDWTA
jgi:DNA modification methylase